MGWRQWLGLMGKKDPEEEVNRTGNNEPRVSNRCLTQTINIFPISVTYLKQRTVHVHSPHLALQVIKHLIGVGRRVVAMGTVWGHAVS